MPWDITARDYVAKLINIVTGSNKTSSDVITVSAVEAVGINLAMDRYNKLAR